MERYRQRGALIYAPNAYFINSGIHAVWDSFPNDRYSLVFGGIGALWKIRPDDRQRLLLATGLSANLVSFYQSYSGGRNDEGNIFMPGIHGNFSFRFTPSWSIDLNMAYYIDFIGSRTVGTHLGSLTMPSRSAFSFSLGPSFRRQYRSR